MKDMQWRVATTEAGLTLGALPARGIPLPDVWDYVPYSSTVSQGEGGTQTHGYRQAEMLWNEMTPYQVFALKDLVDTARASAGKVIYFTVPLLDGSSPNANWTDISGKPFLDKLQQAAPPHANGFVYKNVKLTLNNISIENEDPTF